jgi:hypothetical protein
VHGANRGPSPRARVIVLKDLQVFARATAGRPKSVKFR